MKKIVALLLSVGLTGAYIAAPVSAANVGSNYTLATNSVSLLRGAYTIMASSSLSISSSTATCTSKFSGTSSVTKVSLVQYLEKYESSTWSTYRGWSTSSNSSGLNVSNLGTNLSSGTYRVRSVYTVYVGTDYETVEVISDSKTCIT